MYGIICEKDPRGRLACDDWGRTILFDTVEDAQACIENNQRHCPTFKLLIKETKKTIKNTGNQWHFNWDYLGKYSPYNLEYKKILEAKHPEKKVIVTEKNFCVNFSIK